MSDPRKISEKVFQAEVIKAARIHGWRIAHFRPGLTQRGRWVTPVQGDGAGFPDCVLIHNKRRRMIFAELKSERGGLSEKQQEWIEDLTSVVVTWLPGMRPEIYVWRPGDIDRIWEILAA